MRRTLRPRTERPDRVEPAPPGARRRRLAAGAVAAAVALGACGSSSSKPAASTKPDTTSAAVSGGTLTVGLETAPDSLDPNAASSADDYTVMRAIFDSLVAETPQHTYVPWLATSWTISPDGRHYTFHLRRDVTFQDGTPFNAAAVKFNLDRIVKPSTESQYAVSLLGPYQSSTVLNDYTIEINLKQRYSPLLEALSQAFLGFESPAAVAKYGKDIGEHPVGTGPFEFSSEVTNEQILLKRYPSYHWGPSDDSHKGPAYLAGIDFKVVSDASTRIGSISSDQLEAIEGIPASQISSLQGNSDIKVYLPEQPGATYAFYPNEDHSPWNTATARLALRDGININAIMQTLYFGHYQRAWSVLSPATSDYDPSLVNSWKYSPSEAEKLLGSLGYTRSGNGYFQKDGKTLTLLMVNNAPDLDSRLEIDTIVQQQLKTVGIKEIIQDPVFAPYATATEKGDYDMESFSVVTGSPSILDTIFNSANQPSAGNFLYNVAHFSSKKVDALAAQAAATPDAAEQAKLYDEIQQIISAGAVAIPVYVPVASFAVQTKVKGLTFDPRAYPLFYDVSLG